MTSESTQLCRRTALLSRELRSYQELRLNTPCAACAYRPPPTAPTVQTTFCSPDRSDRPGFFCVSHHQSGRLRGNNGSTAARFVLITGDPIGESVVQRGLFVMTTEEEVSQVLRGDQSGTNGFERASRPPRRWEAISEECGGEDINRSWEEAPSTTEPGPDCGAAETLVGTYAESQEDLTSRCVLEREPRTLLVLLGLPAHLTASWDRRQI
ncbi:hypothetical protein CRUP_010516 [Coryphaenoides rupestris]|nr:hypothetical protein CRUP_010516 [Coryphaenoides rupestris]